MKRIVLRRLFLGGNVSARQDWIAALGEALLLAALALILVGSSGRSLIFVTKDRKFTYEKHQ